MKSINLKENQFIQFHQKISFKFDGVKYFGYKGDTIASALLRNNINLVGRSFKYHRPRGIYTCINSSWPMVLKTSSYKVNIIS